MCSVNRPVSLNKWFNKLLKKIYALKPHQISIYCFNLVFLIHSFLALNVKTNQFLFKIVLLKDFTSLGKKHQHWSTIGDPNGENLGVSNKTSMGSPMRRGLQCWWFFLRLRFYSFPTQQMFVFSSPSTSWIQEAKLFILKI